MSLPQTKPLRQRIAKHAYDKVGNRNMFTVVKGRDAEAYAVFDENLPEG